MATPDYAKTLADVKKIKAENIAIWKKLGTDMDNGVKRALEIRDTLAYGLEDFDKLCNRIEDGMDAWIVLADEIVPLQKQQQEARKKKDKAKVLELEKEIKPIDAKATKEQKAIQKALADANAAKDHLMGCIKALDKVDI